MIPQSSASRCVLPAGLIVLTSTVALARPKPYLIDPATSRVEVLLDVKGSLTSLRGIQRVTAGEFSGFVQLDPERLADTRLDLRARTGSLSSTSAGLTPADRSRLEEALKGPRGLDAGRFSTLAFRTGRVQVKSGSGVPELVMHGTLEIKGQEQPIALPFRLRQADGRPRLTGGTWLRQTRFGIQPYSAAFGTCRVEDRFELRLDLGFVAPRAFGSSPLRASLSP